MFVVKVAISFSLSNDNRTAWLLGGIYIWAEPINYGRHWVAGILLHVSNERH